MSAIADIPTEHTEETNTRILSVSEDMVQGFVRYPFQAIAERSGVPLATVLERIRAMLEAGVIRRVRQTMLATKLAHGALVAWKVDNDKLDATFDWMFREDPFSGHVVTRSTDREVSGSDYRLWTTLKVPQGKSLEEHADVLKRLTGAHEYLLMPANGIFALGVGHVRRKTMEPGDKADEPVRMETTATVELSDEEWEVLLALKEELTPDEICEDPWVGRAAKAGTTMERFCEVAEILNEKRVIGRFSTFLEHVKPSESGTRVTRFNGLFHWAVPAGMEQPATWILSKTGQEISGCCIQAATRDFARVGQFIMNGAMVNGKSIVPDGWLADATTTRMPIGQPERGYGYQWWTYADGSYSARGIFGQGIFIDPKRKLVIALNANWGTGANDRALGAAREAFYQAVQKAVDDEPR